MASESQRTLLVSGANGKLGRKVVELLLEAKAGRVIAGSRDTKKLADLSAKGAETRRADFDDPASLKEAFAGVGRALIISTDALGAGKRGRQHQAAIAAAKAAGVKHLVYTSMPKPEPGNAVIFASDHRDSERALADSGLGYTVLRNNWYQENLLGSLPNIIKSGKWFSSAGDGRIAHVSHDDCARAAAAALASEASGNQRYDISGPRALTTGELAGIVAEVVGAKIQVVKTSDEQLAAGMKAAGVPEGFVAMLVSFDVNQRQGGFDVVSGDVKALTGRPPREFRDFVIANRAALAS